MITEQTKRSCLTSVEIKSLLETFKLSGSNTREFCKTHAISKSAFYRWRMRYSAGELVKENPFIILKQQPVPSPAEPALFAEVKGIKVYQAVEASYLKELLT